MATDDAITSAVLDELLDEAETFSVDPPAGSTEVRIRGLSARSTIHNRLPSKGSPLGNGANGLCVDKPMVSRRGGWPER